MSSVVISGDTSGAITLSAPAVSGTNTQTLVAATGTLAPLIAGTAVASTSGTSIDFTSIPSWVKRITVMFNGVSVSGTSSIQVQIGNGSFINTGYTSSSVFAFAGTPVSVSSTAGFVVYSNAANYAYLGSLTILNITGNTWVESHSIGNVAQTISSINGGGSIALGGTLDRVRITTVNGTDTFDAGSINILYE